MSDYVAQLAAAAQAAEILSPLRIAWFGQPSAPLDPVLRAPLLGASAGSLALATLLLRERLYSRFYLTGGAIPGDPPPAPPIAGDAAFISTLIRANRALGCRDAGWEVLATDHGGLRVRKDGLTLVVAANELETSAAGVSAIVTLPASLPALRPGALLLRGELPLPASEPLARIYWSLTAAGAGALVAELSDALDRLGIPWELKLPNHPAAFTRADAGVLYLRHDDLPLAAPALERAWRLVAGWLRASTPALTRPLAPGVALADDPGGSESFGAHRCRLLAEGIARAHASGQRRLSARLEAVAEVFAEAGIAFETPYLAPDAAEIDLTDWRPDAYYVALPARDDPLAVAAALGERLARAAIRHDGRVSWLAPDDADPLAGSWRTLGPGLYDGLSGSALFLSELHAATGDPTARETALAALRQALRLARAPGTAPGFYDGRAGVAWVAARAARLLDAPELGDAAHALAAGLRAPDASARCDLLGGLAGLIAGLVLLCDELRDESLLAPAIVAADRLLAHALPIGDGLAWPAPEGALPLTGVAHGASGIASALLALHAASGEARFRDAALAAFRWERGWRDAAHGNWPDFRGVLPRLARAGVTLPAARAWCHGAPGIALARLAALDDPSTREDAALALATTRAAVRATLDERIPDGCLCHGLAGLVEVLRSAAPLVPGDDTPLLAEASAALAARAAATEQPLPGLFTGDAGIGLALLRAAGAPAPCVLAPWQAR